MRNQIISFLLNSRKVVYLCFMVNSLRLCETQCFNQISHKKLFTALFCLSRKDSAMRGNLEVYATSNSMITTHMLSPRLWRDSSFFLTSQQRCCEKLTKLCTCWINNFLFVICPCPLRLLIKN